MADTKNIPPETAADQSSPAETPPEKELDRQSYLKEIRQNLLTNLGLPQDTKPEQVLRLLEIKQTLKKMQH
ncbi:MAG: hypothetical protein LBV79_05730 [Candidatus Adiutrix sp.]|jgi:hypothetical protein|nr:hypothetical protein [Candidatus Adiutrix sp.]